uniref:Uncharacterized protein LOC104245058 n=1 Tax=Nicotiana sylvestris TaxID=4096 RepID=A0A1U7YAE6_NICSY|nr:PREDICTED: uncharacterized protein LOC104245058 [Nicotiana sylvestris]
MAGNGEEKRKAIADLNANLLNTINEAHGEDEENVTPSGSSRRRDSSPPYGSVTASHGKGASTPPRKKHHQRLRIGKARSKGKMATEYEVRPKHRKSNALCKFHQERGHKTEDYIALRQEGRRDTSINNIKFTTTQKLRRSITHEWYDKLEESIIFDKSDTHGLVFPHYDALVITLRVFDTDIRRIMVDDGTGACIIHPRFLTQMKLEDRIVPCCITLTGFNNAIERTSGEITLPVLVGGVTLETTFHIMDQDTTYNAIIGRPWIHDMKTVPSSSYQVIKFPPLGSLLHSGRAMHGSRMLPHHPRLHIHNSLKEKPRKHSN